MMWITALNWKGNTKCSESIHLSLQFMADHSFESIILTKSKVQFFLNFKISYKVCTIILCWMLSRPIMIIYRIFMNFPSAIHLNECSGKNNTCIAYKRHFWVSESGSTVYIDMCLCVCVSSFSSRLNVFPISERFLK